MIRASLRRFALALTAICASVALIGTVGGLLTGAGPARGVSLAFYVAGAFGAVLGLLAGVHGPLRRAPAVEGRSAGVRLSSREEREEALSLSALLVVGGMALLVIGLVIDPRVRVV